MYKNVVGRHNEFSTNGQNLLQGTKKMVKLSEEFHLSSVYSNINKPVPSSQTYLLHILIPQKDDLEQ